MAKKFTYMNKSLEDMKSMNLNELATLLPSRQRRSLLRRSEEIIKFVQRLEKKSGKGKKIKTHKRDMIVMPQMVNMVISVYNGKEFIPVNIREEMIGHYLGEFALTRRRIQHGAAGIGATRSSKAASKKTK